MENLLKKPRKQGKNILRSPIEIAPVASFKNLLETAYHCLTNNLLETVCGFSSFLASFILLALKV
ncbi:MAG: hypothetical protein ACYCXF_07765, partial [Thermoleophilia bacterium]